MKVQGEFVWHTHDDTDELFIVIAGELTIRLRDGDVRLSAGQLLVVPRGVEHCHLDCCGWRFAGIVRGGVRRPAVPSRFGEPMRLDGFVGLSSGRVGTTEGGSENVGEVWSWVHAERAALVKDLANLDDDSWETPSLCEGWSIHEVVAHLVNTAKTTRLSFLLDLARARFDFDRQNARGVERERGRTSAETLEKLRAVASRTSTPPAPLDTRLVEEIVHGEDIRRPLGLTHNYATEAVVRSLRVQGRTPASFGGAKELLRQVQLVAVDDEVSLGAGPAVSGPALSLLLAISGRQVALDDLEGPGIAALRRV